MPVPVELLMIGASLVIGVTVCALLITPLLRRHFRYLDEHPRWYERRDDED